MKRSAKVLVTTFVVLASVVIAPVAAGAAPGGDGAPGGEAIHLVAPMKVVGFDAKVAAANGYEIRTASDGTPYSVKVGSAEGPTAQNRLPGECGWSHVYFTPIGNRKAVINTGFDVTPAPAVDYSWTVTVIDMWGVSNKGWGGPLWFRNSWVGTHTFTSSGAGYATAEVTVGIAILANGWICYSHGPWAGANIF